MIDVHCEQWRLGVVHLVASATGTGDGNVLSLKDAGPGCCSAERTEVTCICHPKPKQKYRQALRNRPSDRRIGKESRRERSRRLTPVTLREAINLPSVIRRAEDHLRNYPCKSSADGSVDVSYAHWRQRDECCLWNPAACRTKFLLAS